MTENIKKYSEKVGYNLQRYDILITRFSIIVLDNNILGVV